MEASDSQSLLPEFPQGPLKVYVSECLVGGEVRHDGGHKRSSMPEQMFQELFDFVPVCPEVGIGLGVPREPIRLVGDVATPRAVGVRSADLDVTDRLESFARIQNQFLDDVDGYVFMKNSPSCGLFRVKVYRATDGIPLAEGRGVYASGISRLRPNLPIEESGRLFDPVLRENFVTRTFVHAHWRALLRFGLSAKSLIAFHSVYKYLVMAHSISGYKTLGRLLSDLSTNLEDVASEYFEGLMVSLGKPAMPGGHANVMSHLQGYVKNSLTGRSRAELANLIEQYRRGEVPLLAPLSLLKHHLGEHDAGYAINQLYLQPHPINAGLRRDL
jgi:uncharacterized protein YbgA (DUF1722 family)/uncharacterized protein YbbK (DUF523 family)